MDAKLIIALGAACAAAAVLLMAAALELAAAGQQAEAAVQRADIAAWEISRLLEEAREITRTAAAEGM